jgi:polysaccharide export outer membrane protein
MIKQFKSRMELGKSKLCCAFVIFTLLACLTFAATPTWGPDSPKPAGTPVNQAIPPPAKGVDKDYIIGPSDALAINVWKDTELSRTVLVRPDGKISLPLVGELEVSGLTALKVQQLIAQKLDPYISKPQVTVIVTEVKSQTYTVVGKISHSGAFELAKPTTVLEAIAIAGGFQEFAKTNKIYIIRRMPDGSVAKLPFDYKKVIKGQDAEANVNLQSGDTIVVP